MRAMLILAVIGLATPAWARRAPERLAVSEFRGPQASRLQGAVESGLMARYYVVPDFTVERAARQEGVSLDGDRDFERVGRSLDLAGFVSARVERRGAWQVRMLVRRGDTGAPAGTVVLADRRLDRLEAQLAQHALGRVQRLLARAAPEPDLRAPEAPRASLVPPSLPEPPEPVVAAQAAPPVRGSPRLLAELALDGRVFSRSFSYHQNLSGLPEYRLPRSFAAALELAMYPGALWSRALAPLGLVGAVELAPAVKSQAAGSEGAAATTVHGYRAGVKYRLAWPAAAVSPQLAYGEQLFRTGAPRAPDVRYRLLWAGVDWRWQPGPLAVSGTVAYLHALSIGGLGEATAFPHLTAQGLHAEVAASLALSPTTEVRLAMGLRQLGLAMHARPGDRWVAGGAVDQVSWLGLGMAYRPRVMP